MEVVWILALLFAFTPAVAWLWLFHSRDRYEPEPERLILKLFVLGVLSVIPIMLVANIALEFVALEIPDEALLVFLALVVMAPLIEEPAKAAVAHFTSRGSRDFDEPVDGMIYFTTVGLGFGALETAFYIVTAYTTALQLGVMAHLAWEPAFLTAIVRGLTATVAHGLWSGIVGYFVGRRRFDPGAPSPWLGLAIAIGAHGLYNLFAPEDFVMGVIVLVPTAVLYYVLFERAVDMSPHKPKVATVAAPAAVVAAESVAPAADVPAPAVSVPAPTTAPPALLDVARRPCPRCGESIASAAVICRFCYLSLSNKPEPGEDTRDG